MKNKSKFDESYGNKVEEFKPLAEPVKEHVKESISKPPEPSKNEPIVILSENDAYINQRMKEQPRSLEDVEIKLKNLEVDNSSRNRLALPNELKKFLDKYAFRWINKNKRSVDYHLDVVGWSLVNRVYFSKLSQHLFTANGTVERGDAILGFIPLKKALEIREAPGKTSRERVENIPVQDLDKWKDRGEQYYKPTLDEGDTAVRSVQPEAVTEEV